MKKVSVKALLIRALKRFSGTESTTLSLGAYVAAGTLTQASGRLYFSIPTGRVFPSGTTITGLTFYITCRASNQSGAGMYVIKSTSGGSNGASFNLNSAFSFYNGANASVSIPAANTSATLYGDTNIYVSLDGDPSATSTYKFSGNATNNGYINNQATTVYLSSIVVTFSFPS